MERRDSRLTGGRVSPPSCRPPHTHTNRHNVQVIQVRQEILCLLSGEQFQSHRRGRPVGDKAKTNGLVEQLCLIILEDLSYLYCLSDFYCTEQMLTLQNFSLPSSQELHRCPEKRGQWSHIYTCNMKTSFLRHCRV